MKALPVLSLVLALTALVVALTRKPDVPPTEPPRNNDRLEAKIRSLENELARLAAGPVNELEIMPGDSPASPSIKSAGTDPQRLEQQLQDLGVLKHFQKRKEKLIQARTTALDTELDQWTRIKALSPLKEAGEIDDEIVSSMMPLWTASLEDPKGDYLRWQLLEDFRGSTNPEFRTNILEWIGEEESPKMRGQALATLAPMADEPNVAEWIEYLAENDPDSGIQQRATRILEGNAEGK